MANLLQAKTDSPHTKRTKLETEKVCAETEARNAATLADESARMQETMDAMMNVMGKALDKIKRASGSLSRGRCTCVCLRLVSSCVPGTSDSVIVRELTWRRAFAVNCVTVTAVVVSHSCGDAVDTSFVGCCALVVRMVVVTYEYVGSCKHRCTTMYVVLFCL